MRSRCAFPTALDWPAVALTQLDLLPPRGPPPPARFPATIPPEQPPGVVVLDEVVKLLVANEELHVLAFAT
jgi:hypothetical protein